MNAENLANRACKAVVRSCSAGNPGSRRVERADEAMSAPEPMRTRDGCNVLLGGVGQHPTVPEQAGATEATDRDCFPSDSTLRAAHALADLLGSGPKARREIADLIDREYSAILGAGDRRELLDNFFAARATRVSGLLTGLGLARSATDSGAYGRGDWTLAVERDGQGHVFIISGIRTTSGGVTSARMSAEVFCSACRAWRAIAKAAGVDERDKPPAAEWRRIWSGGSSKRRTVVGIRTALHRVFMIGRNGGDHESK